MISVDTYKAWNYYNSDILKNMSDSKLICAFINADDKTIISNIYASIQNTKKHSTSYIKQKWEKELSIQITEE